MGKAQVIERIFDAPISKVWAAWTEPKSVMKWWGPKDFTAPTIKIDLVVDGKFLYCMRGEAGPGAPMRDYWNAGKFVEVIPEKRIVSIINFSDDAGATVPASYYGMEGSWPLQTIWITDFEEVEGRKTKLTIEELGIPLEMRVMSAFGWEQSLDKLSNMLKGEASDAKYYETMVTHTVDAPLKTVWDAWTKKENLAKWWGPKDSKIKVARLDLERGEIFHYSMTSPDGKKLWGKFTYHDINAPRLLTFTNSFSDKDGGVTRNPWIKEWPLEVSNILMLSEDQGKTMIVLLARPLNASERELETFFQNKKAMEEGFAGTWEMLDKHLAGQTTHGAAASKKAVEA